MTTIVRDFERRIRAFVAEGSGLDPKYVIPGNDPHPRPSTPYATLLRIPPDVRRAYPVRYQQANGTTTSISYRRAAFSLQFYRKDSMELADAFVIYAESENGLTMAEDGEFAVVQVPALSWERIDDIIGDAYEQRALVNLMIDYARTTSQNTGVIDQIEGTVDYDGIIATIDHP